MILITKKDDNSQDSGIVQKKIVLNKISPRKDNLWLEPRPGNICQVCNRNVLDYDGLLNLVCPDCGTVSGGCFT